MNVHQLKLFKAVADAGSFSRAARTLYLAQSTVSTQMRRLERSVGLTLFRRTKRGLALSDAGAALYASACAILDHHDLAERRLDALRAGAQGVVTVGASQTGALYGLLDAVRDYRVRQVGVRIHVEVDVADRLLQRLVDGALDMGLEWEPLARPELAHEALGRYGFLVVASPSSPLAGLEVIDPDRFREETYFTLRYGSDSPAFVESELARRGLLPRRVVRLPSIDTVKLMISAGLGVSVLSSLSVRQEVREGRLVALPLAGFRLERTVRLFHNPDLPLPPAGRDFLGFLRTHPALAGLSRGREDVPDVAGHTREEGCAHLDDHVAPGRVEVRGGQDGGDGRTARQPGGVRGEVGQGGRQGVRVDL